MSNLYPGYGVPWFWLHYEIVKGPIDPDMDAMQKNPDGGQENVRVNGQIKGE